VERFHTRIGEHTLQIDCASPHLLSILLDEYAAYELPPPAEPDIRLTIEGGYGVPFVDYEVAVTAERGSVVYRRADYRIDAEQDYKRARIRAHDALAFKHAMMNYYSAYIVHHRWGLLLHASCAVEGGGAHLFAGPSGAGKSTAAKLSVPRLLLSDEATLVKITPGAATVWNSPFRSELPTTHPGMCCPLASIQLLVQAKLNDRIRCPSSAAFVTMASCVFYWAHARRETANVLGLLRQLVGRVPVYELHFQNNGSFWELIS
jgi:hypothetical protein